MAWGGARDGAGRPRGRGDSGPRLAGGELEARLRRLVRTGSTARDVLEAVGDRELWLRLLSEAEADGDWHIVADALKFLTQMRDGRPAQQINITSQHLTLSAHDISRMREVVRELRAGAAPMLPAIPAPGDPSAQSHGEISSPAAPMHDAIADAPARADDSIMVEGDEGGSF